MFVVARRTRDVRVSLGASLVLRGLLVQGISSLKSHSMKGGGSRLEVVFLEGESTRNETDGESRDKEKPEF